MTFSLIRCNLCQFPLDVSPLPLLVGPVKRQRLITWIIRRRPLICLIELYRIARPLSQVDQRSRSVNSFRYFRLRFAGLARLKVAANVVDFSSKSIFFRFFHHFRFRTNAHDLCSSMVISGEISDFRSCLSFAED
jgi:hypothetical protein